MSHNKTELIPELRQLWQDLLTNGEWTITEAEAEELLYLTSPNLLLWSVKATQRYCTRKHIVLEPDQTLNMVRMYIGQANKDREASVSTRKSATTQKAEDDRQRAEQALMFEGREDERGR
jgi:hypothetical protein